MILKPDEARRLGAFGQKRIVVVSPSSGLRSQAARLFESGAVDAGRRFVCIDTRKHASTPQRWASNLLTRLGLEKPSGSPFRQLKQSCEFPEDAVIFLENGEDFFLLSRYPGCREFLPFFFNHTASCRQMWVFGVKSDQQIPCEPACFIYTLEAWDPVTADQYLQELGVFIPGPFLEHIVRLTGGYPEYIYLLAGLISDLMNPLHLDTMVVRELSRHDSPLSMLCRLRWLEILHQARGYCALKAVLEILALYSDIRLSDLAKKLENSPPAVKDYLNALIKVGAVIRDGWNYRLNDPMLAQWLKLDHSGRTLEKPVETGLFARFQPDNSVMEFD
ncbi:hypothetical protein JXA40_00985 [bacterium]|nr:hypothetical protein [candidate division CSSED10-310 bacterium]